MSRAHRHAAMHFLALGVQGLEGTSGLSEVEQLQRLTEVAGMASHAVELLQAAIHMKADKLVLASSTEPLPITEEEVEEVDFEELVSLFTDLFDNTDEGNEG